MPSKAIRANAITSPQPAVEPCSWPAPPQDIVLHSNAVHIWCAAPRAFSQSLARFHSLLSTEERERAAKFHFAADRDSYTIRHGLRRLFLSRYTRQDPSQIEFAHGPFGKPEIKADGASLFFNDSHSAELALFAVTSHCPLGVDIECMRPIPEFENIAARFFSPPEVQMMRELSPDQRMTAFYSCWTAKEAYLKATGEGIGAGLDKVEVTLDQDLQAVALRVPADSEASDKWSVRAFSPALGYLGAVAVNAEISKVSLWRFPAGW
jgi:4'-phosphopantetheinyl transferase